MNQGGYENLDKIAKDAGKTAIELLKYEQIIEVLERMKDIIAEIKEEIESIDTSAIDDLKRYFADKGSRADAPTKEDRQ